MSPQFTDLANARLDEQRQTMQRSEADGVCPFCPNHLAKYHKEPILIDGQFWVATANSWPYKHTKHQFLLISKMHAETLTELPAEAGQELLEMSQKLIAEYKIPGGALCMRFGNTDYSAGTVKHLHAQLIMADIEADDYEPVRFKIGATRR